MAQPTKHFVMQRFTAAIQVPLVLWLVFSIVIHANDTHAEFISWLGEWLTVVLLITFICSVFFHMQLGMSEVIDDYIHKPGTRKSLSFLNSIFTLILGAVALFSIIIITFL